MAIQSITSHIPKLIIVEHNVNLMCLISLSEVESEIMNMALGKSPSLDGFTSDFFHYSWPIFKQGFWALLAKS
jgi:hypothetical protein